MQTICANDPPDQSGKPLFKHVLKACGPLTYGQIYAPRLHPALGGPIVAEAFRPVSAFEALLIAAQTGPFILHDTSTLAGAGGPGNRLKRSLCG